MQSAINSAINALQDAVNSTRPVPVGAVFYMAKSTVPYGYLEANGQTVSRTTYAALWQYLGSPNTGDGAATFNLPDYRGEFIRGWDHGRGVDTNREIGSIQYSQNQEHNHGIPGDDQLTFANGYGGWSASNRGNFPYDARSSYGGGGAIWNTTTEGGNESRPRNVALMPIIKW
jgi:phage-related tail fiber protein